MSLANKTPAEDIRQRTFDEILDAIRTTLVSAAGTLGAVSIVDDRIPGGNKVFVSRNNFMMVQEFGSPLMFDPFNTIDTSGRWTETIVGSATQTILNATLELAVTTGATDSIEEFFRQLDLQETTGTFAKWECGMRFGTDNPVNHRKEWGFLSPDKLDGVFFRIRDDELFAVTRLAGTDTEVSIDSDKPSGATFNLFSIEALGAGKIVFLINNQTVLDLVPAGGARIGNKLKVPFLRVYNTAAPATTPSIGEWHWVNLVDLSGSKVTLVGVDNNNFARPVKVNSEGRLQVSQEPPGTPAGATAVIQTAFSSMSGVVDTFIPITNGKTLTISRFAAGAEVDNTSGNKIEIFEDPNGDLSVLNVIDVIFASGNSDQHDLGQEFIGDGTRRILLRRSRLGGGAKEIFGRVEGFEEDT